MKRRIAVIAVCAVLLLCGVAWALSDAMWAVVGQGVASAPDWTIRSTGTNQRANTVQLTGVQSGDFILIWVSCNTSATAVTAVTDGNSTDNANFVITTYGGQGGGYYGGHWVYLLSSSATGTVTYTMTSGNWDALTMTAWCIGHASSVSIDQILTPTGDGASYSTYSTGNITTTGTKEIVFGGTQFLNDTATCSSFTINGISVDDSQFNTANTYMQTGHISGYKIFTETFTGAASWTWSSTNVALRSIISFKQ